MAGTGAFRVRCGGIRSPGAGANASAPAGRPNTARSAGETVGGGGAYVGGSGRGSKPPSTPSGRAKDGSAAPGGRCSSSFTAGSAGYPAASGRGAAEDVHRRDVDGSAGRVRLHPADRLDGRAGAVAGLGRVRRRPRDQGTGDSDESRRGQEGT